MLPLQESRFDAWLEDCFPGGSDGKASACSVGDPDAILGSGRSPGEGNGSPLQYSCLENPMDRGAWCRLLSMESQRVRPDWAISLQEPSGLPKEQSNWISTHPCRIAVLLCMHMTLSLYPEYRVMDLCFTFKLLTLIFFLNFCFWVNFSIYWCITSTQ